MKPWREIATPHADVLSGTFQQSEFAADLTRVFRGEATPEYQDAEQFFARTYLTKGTKDLLVMVARRMAGDGGEPVVNLLTNFGGGKTHTLLAVYHLLTRKGNVSKLRGVKSLLEENGLSSIPKANVAVIDGIAVAPNQPTSEEGLKIHTLWGLLAYRLLGKVGYEMVRDSDESGTAPGKEILADVLRKAAPCVILMDELVAFERQIVAATKVLQAGSFEANTSFFQALTEAAKAVGNSMVLAALPASDVEVSGEGGKAAFDMLGKVFGRVNSVWKPGTADEGFEIVKRRLFSEIRDDAGVDETCRTYAKFYLDHTGEFPPDVRKGSYADDLRKSYPIHPEVFERLYTDWSTLQTFQRTRGVLQYMALVIHRLWNDNNKNAMIMPGDLPLFDKTVQDKSLHYLSDGWAAVVDREVDGDRSAATQVDSGEDRFGSIQAARRITRTIFLGSAASNREGNIRGLTKERILLGSVIPGQSPSTYSDALDALTDNLQYLFNDGNRYWFDTHPTLRREMESRSDRVTQAEIDDNIHSRLQLHLCKGRGQLLFHVFPRHADIEDIIDKPRLVILGLDASYSPQAPQGAFNAATTILEHHGDKPREKRNRLFFLAPDFQQIRLVREAASKFKAWTSIVEDIRGGKMDNIDLNQQKQALESVETSKAQLDRALASSYIYLINPVQEGDSGVGFQVERLGAGPDPIDARAEKIMLGYDWIVPKWNSTELSKLLSKYYFKGDCHEVSVKKLWNDLATYYYMPRLTNQAVLDAVIRNGVKEGLFGYASGTDGDRYVGLAFNELVSVLGDVSSGILVEKTVAAANKPKTVEPGAGPGVLPGFGGPGVAPGGNGTSLAPSKQAQTTQRVFNASGHADGLGFLDLAQLIDNEILKLFTSDPNVRIGIGVDIRIEKPAGFTKDDVRNVSENANTIGLENASFE